VLSPYELNIIESCLTCRTRADPLFCNLPGRALEALEKIKHPIVYPKGAVLYIQGQAPRRVWVVCQGTVKLSLCSRKGKTLTVKCTEQGEVLGLSAGVSGEPYESTAEAIEPCQVNFVRRNDFVRFLKEHPQARFRCLEQLSEKYQGRKCRRRTASGDRKAFWK